MKIRAIAVLALSLSMSQLALAQEPIVRQGSKCPTGYMKSRGYCVPFPSAKRKAIERSGSNCPIGWYKSGKYCTRRVVK